MHKNFGPKNLRARVVRLADELIFNQSYLFFNDGIELEQETKTRNNVGNSIRVCLYIYIYI